MLVASQILSVKDPMKSAVTIGLVVTRDVRQQYSDAGIFRLVNKIYKLFLAT